MLINKIYKHISKELLRNFFIILVGFTLIAWTVRAVNYLNLIIDDAHSISTYFTYSFLNLTNIISKFIPISFLLALITTIYKFKNQKEFLILWSNGISKTSIVNLFVFISLFVIGLNLLLSVYITPFALNYSRYLLKTSDLTEISSAIKENDFTDTFKNITFFVESKNDNNEFKNIFIRDESNTLSNLVNSEKAEDKTIVAQNGFIKNNKLYLSDGTIHSFDGKKISSLKFKKTEFSLETLTNRTIQQPKLRETKTSTLLTCLTKKNSFLLNCPIQDLKTEVIENLTRRIAMPLYILIISLICCFALISKQEREKSFLKKYFIFVICFLLIIISEFLVRFAGKSELLALGYFFIPIILSPLIYLLIIIKTFREKIV